VSRLSRIHRTAVIVPEAVIGEDVVIGPGCVLGAYPLAVHTDRTTKHRVRKECRGSVVIERGVDIGPNSVVHRGTVRDTVIGEGSFIGTFVNVGHDVRIGKHCIIASGTQLLGFVEIGDDTYIGAGTDIRERVKVGKEAYLGMGSLVLEDIKDGGYGFGRPFQHMKKKPLSKMRRYLGRYL
jgi:UDP-3-O-[3-hydroxymyristoyl] glucosamine N-acyltransferase